MELMVTLNFLLLSWANYVSSLKTQLTGIQMTGMIIIPTSYNKLMLMKC